MRFAKICYAPKITSSRPVRPGGFPGSSTLARKVLVHIRHHLQRALLLVNLGLRDEARREWNFSLRGMDDRGLMAAARLACERQDWQLCINTADRTRTEVDLRLRYPMPFADEITAAVGAIVADLGASGPGDMGKVMAAVKAQLAGKADMGAVSAAVKAALAK